MARRTYLPTLVALAKLVVIYVTRNRQKIEKNLDPVVVSPLLDSLLETLQILIELAEVEPNP